MVLVRSVPHSIRIQKVSLQISLRAPALATQASSVFKHLATQTIEDTSGAFLGRGVWRMALLSKDR